jgi:protein-tyrosine phosphatase
MFIEFPSDHIYSGIKELIFELTSEGIIPIIAHPERNSVFIRNMELLYDLIQLGSLSQANSGSFNHRYGTQVEEAAFRLLEMNLIHFVGSDAHNPRTSAPRLMDAVKKIEVIIGEEKARALVVENPQAVLSDLEIPYFPEPVDPREREKKLRIKIPRIFRKK